jgi:hypothetical protein
MAQGGVHDDAIAATATMLKRCQGNVCNDASAAMTPAPRRQQWQWRQGHVRNDASTMTATMPKRCQGDFCNDASAVMATMATAPGQHSR